MNSRERVLAAIGHREPDRVPVDLGATPSSGISAIAYNNLVKHLGLKVGSTKVYDVVQRKLGPVAGQASARCWGRVLFLRHGATSPGFVTAST